MLQEDVARRVLIPVRLQPAKLAPVILRATGIVQSPAATAALRRVALLAHHHLLPKLQGLLDQALAKPIMVV